MVQVARPRAPKSPKTLNWVLSGGISTVALLIGAFALLSPQQPRDFLQEQQQTSALETSLAAPSSVVVPFGSRRELWNGPFVPSTIGDVGTSSSWINDYNLVHVVNTRFMQHQADLQHLGMARVGLFNTFTLPSMRQQSNQQYLWLIWTDANLHDPVKSTFLKILQESQMQNILVLAPTTTDMDSSSTFRSLYGYSWGDLTTVLYGNVQLLADYYKASQTHLLLETSLDADDALSQSFVETAQAEAAYDMEHHAVDSSQRQVYCPEFHAEWRYYQPNSLALDLQQQSQRKHSNNPKPLSGSEQDKKSSWLSGSSRTAPNDDRWNATEADGHLVHMHNRNFCIKSGLTIAYHLKAEARRLFPCIEAQEHSDCSDMGRRSLGSTKRNDDGCKAPESVKGVESKKGDNLRVRKVKEIDWTSDMCMPKFTIPDGTKKLKTCGSQCSQPMDYKNYEQKQYCPAGSMLCRGKDYASDKFQNRALFSFAEMANTSTSATVRVECRPSDCNEDIVFFDVNILEKSGEYVTKFSVDYYGTKQNGDSGHCVPWNHDKDYKVTMAYLQSSSADHHVPVHSYFTFDPTESSTVDNGDEDDHSGPSAPSGASGSAGSKSSTSGGKNRNDDDDVDSGVSASSDPTGKGGKGGDDDDSDSGASAPSGHAGKAGDDDDDDHYTAASTLSGHDGKGGDDDDDNNTGASAPSGSGGKGGDDDDDDHYTAASALSGHDGKGGDDDDDNNTAASAPSGSGGKGGKDGDDDADDHYTAATAPSGKGGDDDDDDDNNTEASAPSGPGGKGGKGGDYDNTSGASTPSDPGVGKDSKGGDDDDDRDIDTGASAPSGPSGKGGDDDDDENTTGASAPSGPGGKGGMGGDDDDDRDNNTGELAPSGPSGKGGDDDDDDDKDSIAGASPPSSPTSKGGNGDDDDDFGATASAPSGSTSKPTTPPTSSPRGDGGTAPSGPSSKGDKGNKKSGSKGGSRALSGKGKHDSKNGATSGPSGEGSGGKSGNGTGDDDDDDDDDGDSNGPSPLSRHSGDDDDGNGRLPVAPYGGSPRSVEYTAYGVNEFAVCVAPVQPPPVSQQEQDCVTRLRLLPEVIQPDEEEETDMGSSTTNKNNKNHPLNGHYKPLQASVLLARTPTAAGMKNVLPKQDYPSSGEEQQQHSKNNNSDDGKNTVILPTFGHVGSDGQRQAWDLVEENFGVGRDQVIALRQEWLQPNMAAILLDAFNGQCTPGHSCKASTKKTLGNLLAHQVHYDHSHENYIG